jgi:hypothetical protein
MINCSKALIGDRWFICIRYDVFPVDRISSIDTAYPSLDQADANVFGVAILLTNPEAQLYWTEDSDAKVIRNFLINIGLNVASED